MRNTPILYQFCVVSYFSPAVWFDYLYHASLLTPFLLSCSVVYSWNWVLRVIMPVCQDSGGHVLWPVLMLEVDVFSELC